MTKTLMTVIDQLNAEHGDWHVHSFSGNSAEAVFLLENVR